MAKIDKWGDERCSRPPVTPKTREGFMGTIETTFEMENGLTLVRGRGKLSIDDFHAWLEEYYPDRVTALILWDETEADLSALDAVALRDLVRRAKRMSGDRRGGKGAVVYANPLEYGIGRMFQTFTEMEGLPYEVQSFQSFDEARKWLALDTPPVPGVKIDHEGRIIRKTVGGELYTERSLKLVREIALVVNAHRGYNIMIDLRGTVTHPEMIDLMVIAAECTKLRSDFNRRIAFLIPDTEERRRFAHLFRACMEAQGFTFRQFYGEDAALAWLGADG